MAVLKHTTRTRVALDHQKQPFPPLLTLSISSTLYALQQIFTVWCPKNLMPISFITALLLCLMLNNRMTIKGGTSQACAACKYQRRRCTPECPLRPYFPADKTKMFQNAHRLFGVCNIMKILKNLTSDQKDEAMKSIIYESDIREKFPVYGCWGITCQLSYQLQQATEELRLVRRQIDLCKERVMYDSVNPSQLELLGKIPVSHDTNQFLFDNVDDEMVKPLFIQNTDNDAHIYPNYSMGMHSHMVPPELHFQMQQEIEVDQDYDDIPFHKLRVTESDQACESSGESSFRGTKQFINHVSSSKGEFKSEASCFSVESAA